MNVQEILELTKAGWSKEEIIALSSSNTQAPTQAEEPVVEPEQPKTVEQKAEPTPAPVVQPSPVMTQEQFTQLLQALNVNNATVDVPPKYDVQESLANHFTSLMIGNNNKED